MLGIYNDNFLEFLESNLGRVKTNPKNIITVCPWCDINRPDRSKDHLWISLDTPIYHCFRAGCNKSGSTWSLISSLNSSANGDVFIDREKIKEYVKQKVDFTRNVVVATDIIYPSLKNNYFQYKENYIMKRLKYNNPSIENIKGLVFDIFEFIRINNITIDPDLARIQDYLQTNFVGFVSENKSVMILRNIDEKASFAFFKMKIQQSKFLDYYKINGYNKNSKNVVLSEGVFDIYGEYLFDSLKIRKDCNLYACGFSTSYAALITSICYYEQIFRMNVHILSDRNVELNYYKNIKKYNSHIIDSLTVYYNKMGKDFNDTPLIIDKFIL